jgi:hypothetical protein
MIKTTARLRTGWMSCLDHDTAWLLRAHILRRAPFADRIGGPTLHDKSLI